MGFEDTCFRYGPFIGTGLLAFGVSVFVFRRMFKSKERICGVDYPKDKVIVHQFQKGTYVPSLSHFVVKLETYLRMAKIPYEPFYNPYGGGPKGKVPWIEYNGTTVADSQFAIQFLNKEFSVDLNKHLSLKERATAWAIQKWLEEFTYWLNVHTKWCIFVDDFLKMYKLPFLLKMLKPLIQREVRKMTYYEGVGRHSNEEVGEMMKHDLRMLSELLGDQKFFMGDQPCELDCAIFGQLAQYRWHTPDKCPGRKLLTDLTNLMAYIDNMKALFWPDWDERITGNQE